MAFSRISEQAIASFASGLGLPATPARDGSYSFVFARTGTLTLTASQDGARVLVSLIRRPSRVDTNLLAAALARAGLDESTGRVVHAGLTADDQLAFSVRLDETECDLPTLDGCFQALAAQHHGLD